MAKQFTVQYANQPWRNRSFAIRGICEHDVLNPCWDNRKTDIPGQHWGGGLACSPCTEAAKAAKTAKRP
jgi:hypothetical protein